MEITREEFNSWKENKVTKVILKGIEKQRDEMKELLASGGTLGDNIEVNTAHLVGRIRSMNDMLNIEYEEAPQYDH